MKYAKQDGIFYGTTQQGFDLYLCDSMGGKSLVARFGNDGADYESCPTFLFKSWLEPGASIGVGARSVPMAEWMDDPTTPDYIRGWKKIMKEVGNG
jgi:hypothetical protein